MVAYKRYKNFFPSGKGNLLQSSGQNASGPNRYISNIIPEGKSKGYGNNEVKGFGKSIGDRGNRYIDGEVFGDHFWLLHLRIDKQLWMYVTAMAYHAKLTFQQNFQKKAFGSGTPWRHLKMSTVRKRRRVGLSGKDILVATGRLRNSLQVIEAGEATRGKKGVTSTLWTDPHFFQDVYPESPTHNMKKRPYKSGWVQTENGYWGRKGRVYAAVHNERNIPGSPWRKFMGHPTDDSGDFLFERLALRLMDDFLFYGVFNRSQELHESSVLKRRESHIVGGRGAANAESKDAILSATNIANDANGNIAATGFTDARLGKTSKGKITE